MGLLSPTDRAALAKDPEKAGEAMESMMLQRMLAGCHLMGKSNAPGAGMRSDLFVEALADAVTKNGGLGLAKQFAAHNPAAAGISSAANSSSGAIQAAASKKTSAPNHMGTGTDLETELLTHKLSLIGIANRADKDLGEP